MSIWRDIKDIFATTSKTPPRPGPKGQSAADGMLMPDEVLSFGDFVAVRLPAAPSSTLAKDDIIKKFASTIAEKVRDALIEFGIQQYTLVEFYVPSDTEKVIKEFFVDRDPNGLRQFERICEGIIFGVGTSDLARGPSAAPRVYVVPQRLNFHPAFDPILNGRIIVRPLGVGNTTIPLNPANANYENDQLLLGLFQVRELTSEPIAEVPIWAWRSIKDQNSIRIDVDFDILSRAFGDADWHMFPLGLAARCSFRVTAEGRVINSVTMDISGVKRWTELLKEAHGESPVKYIQANAGDDSNRLDLTKHTLDSVELRKERASWDFSIGIDEEGEERRIPVNRVFSMRVTSERGYVYIFGFFDKALNYVPARNVMSVTGQLVPAEEPTEIMVPPGPDSPQEPVFRLTPTDQPGRFRLDVLKSTYSLTLNAQPLSYSDDVPVEISDVIRATPNAPQRGRADDFNFQLRDLSLIPEEVRSRPNRPYAAWVKVGVPTWRQFVLHDREHVFGRGRPFNENTHGLAPDALRFKRPWVSLTVLPGRGQDVFLTKRAEGSGGAGKYKAVLLPRDGRELDLNANYEVYVGDFQITLILRATPATSFL